MNVAWVTSCCGVPYRTLTDNFVVASLVPYGQLNVTVVVALGRPYAPVAGGFTGVGDGAGVVHGLVA